jgi:hypothetical protein
VIVDLVDIIGDACVPEMMCLLDVAVFWPLARFGFLVRL